MPLTENEFPTIRDLRDRLSELVASGLGELPVQILVVPDSTLQTLARNAGATDDDKPALMIDLMDAEGNSVLIASADRFGASVPDLHRRTLVQ